MTGQRAKLLGLRFGTLLVLEELDCTREQGVRWLCRCDCGNHLIKETRALKRGKHSSCYACDAARKRDQFTTHGDGKAGARPALYKAWLSMRERCNNPEHPFFHCYGGKGVQVCREWNDYSVFKAWALANGYVHRPDLPLGDRASVDRKDPSGHYCPANCRIIPHRVNARRLPYTGEVSHLHVKA